MLVKNAFARAKAMMALVREAMLITSVVAREQAIAQIGTYKSRGKGRGTPARNYLKLANRSKYKPHQGAREMARRQRAMS